MSGRLSRLRRDAFTLLEMLVVIAIVGVLVALTTAAVMQVADSQRASTTESNMRAVYRVLAQQWQGVLDMADKENIPDGVVAMAGGDGRRARVIWKCLRLRQEFPMTFAEASTDLVIGTDTLKAKKIYADAVFGFSGKWYVENATCVLLALQQNRGGVALSLDNIPGSVAPNGINGRMQLVDGYGFPMVLYRFPTGNSELDGKNPAKLGSRAATYRNPLDPEGTLMDPSWNFNGNLAVANFEALCFSVHAGSGPTYSPISTYMVPTLVSPGRNGKYGFSIPTPFFPATPTDWDPTPPDWSMTVPIDLVNDPQGYAINNANDNIYSFRLGIDKRGD
ncbi:MAG: prepilin-type N-terminal cleavage/methylation domain-containing protein [Planctomycetes bacterium]|nr:prepilin-type N-terminal cleavage/methylation domain-containing protein [Planctomycetota bacterium]